MAHNSHCKYMYTAALSMKTNALYIILSSIYTVTILIKENKCCIRVLTESCVSDIIIVYKVRSRKGVITTWENTEP